MAQSELLAKVIDVLEATHTPYMLTGSYVSSLQGEPRLTHDIDFVIDIEPAAVQPLLAAFPPPDFYLDGRSIVDAMIYKTQFNLLHIASTDKVDFWLLTDDPFDQSRFTRRHLEDVEGRRLPVSQPEDTILMKLRWAELSGGSQKQYGDAMSIYELQHDRLDLIYMEKWAAELKLDTIWDRLKAEADVFT